ncbi:MAG: hypothetical protein ABFS86_17845 [Planctomycetota bacterium]
MARTVLTILIAATLAVAAGEMKGDTKRAFDSAKRMARTSRFNERQQELLAKKLEDVPVEGLARIIDTLRAEPKPGKSRDAVLAWLEKRYLTERYGAMAAEKINGLYALRNTKDPAEMEKLLTAASMLDDFSLAKEIAVRETGSQHAAVRIRALIVLSELMAWRAVGPEEEGAFVELFEDSSPAVRAMAVRRGFAVRFDPVFSLAISLIDDGAKAKATIRGEETSICPGEEALQGLTELTWIDRETVYRQFAKKKDEEKKALIGEFRAWWEKRGKVFPVPGFREAAFQRKPGTTKDEIVAADAEAVVFKIWSGKDRTRMRVLVDEIRTAALSLWDWKVDFHVKYMSSGMRPDDGEAYARDLFTGTPYVMARKKTGCFVLVFQNLIDGRMRVRLDFHDPLR